MKRTVLMLIAATIQLVATLTIASALPIPARPVAPRSEVADTKTVIRGWLNTGYAATNGISPGAVRDSLTEHGVPSATVETAMDEMEDDGEVNWSAEATKTARLYKTADTDPSSLIDLLIRAGYTPDQAMEAALH